MFSIDRRVGFLGLGLTAASLVLFHEQIQHVLAGLLSGTHALEAGMGPAPAEQNLGVCVYRSVTESSLDKDVETPDMKLADASTLQALKADGGWFVVNLGSEDDPIYQLGRVDSAHHTIHMGQKVTDLSLLGPSSIPELSEADLVSTTDAWHVSADMVREDEMKDFYHMPVYDTWQPSEEYRERLATKAALLPGPIAVGKDGLSDIEPLRKVLVDKVVVEPTGAEDVQGGARCKNAWIAETKFNDAKHGGEVVIVEYPLLTGMDPEHVSWVRAHELGHVLDRDMRLGEAFNDLPSWKRAALLAELKNFEEYLGNSGQPVDAHETGPESIGDFISEYLRHPNEVRTHAPRMAAFVRGLVEKDPVLKHVLKL